MDVLTIINDTNVLREGSPEREVIMDQAKLVKRMYVIVMNPHSDQYPVQRVSESLWFIPTNSWFGSLAAFDAARTAKRELYFQGRLQVDFITVHDAHRAGFAGFLLSRKYQRPFNVQLRTRSFSPMYIRTLLPHGIRWIVSRFVLRNASSIHAGSEHIRRSLTVLGTAVLDRAVTIPEFFDIQAIQDKPAITDLSVRYPQFRFVILMIGPLTFSQNHQLAVRSLARMLKEYPHAGLVIIGEGYMERAVRALSKRLDIEKHVVFEPFVEDVVGYIKAADVFLLTSLSDEHTDMLMTAAASGAPIVSTRVGLAQTLITDGESGFLCRTEGVGCFATALLKLVNDWDLRTRVREKILESIARATTESKTKPLRLTQKEWDRMMEQEESLH